MVAFSHPTLGKLIPRSTGNVDQFLGLKYASLRDRLAPPEIYVSSISSGERDANKHGPSVLCPPIGCNLEFSFIQKELELPEFAASGTEGLNLNVNIPAGIKTGDGLPVFVFLHGGGYAIGGNSWPQYDQAKFVQNSIEQGQPIISININYRLGVFGFLTSEELRRRGYPGNNGLRDQQVAFQWIRANIEGFGGDPENITVGGESAGGVSTTLHLYSQTPQFNRAVSFGGTALLLQPLPAFMHETTYRTVMDVLGIASLSTGKQLETLLSTPYDEILTKLPPGLPFRPLIDDDLIPSIASFRGLANKDISNIPGFQWCEDLMIGDSQLDATILIGAMENRPGRLVDNFINSVTQSLANHPGVAEEILKTYNIIKTMSNADGILSILNFATHIGFFVPTLTYAKSWPGKCYVYFFNEPNPWEGRFKGHSSHILDVAFLFQNYSEHLSYAKAQSAKAFATDLIKFINGKEPWDRYNDKSIMARVYGPSNKSQAGPIVLVASGSDVTKTQRDAGIFKFAQEPGFDVIAKAFGDFLAGRYS